MKLKICGMNLNTEEVAELRPDYLGFIFWEPSSRFFNGDILELPSSIQKVGVFVNATVEEILDKVKKYDLQAVQLHGDESPKFCDGLRIGSSAVETSLTETKLKIMKVFSIKDDFDFSILKPYEEVCDYFLFDTKGKLPGGNGYAFEWGVLKNYPSTKPYFLSGGIGLEDVETIKEFMQRPESGNCYAIDVNSRFEIEPGLKDIGRLKKLKETLQL